MQLLKRAGQAVNTQVLTEEALNNFYHHHDSTEVGQEQQCITESKVKATMKKPSN